MIAGAGFATMAWALAQRRVYPNRAPSHHPPFPRGECVPGRKPASTEYYRIIDRASEIVAYGPTMPGTSVTIRL